MLSRLSPSWQGKQLQLQLQGDKRLATSLTRGVTFDAKRILVDGGHKKGVVLELEDALVNTWNSGGSAGNELGGLH